MQPLNETARRQEAISLMNALGPLVGVVVDPGELVKHVLQFGFGVADPEKFLIKQQTPQDMEAAQAEAGAAPDPFGGQPGMPPPPMGGGAGPMPNQAFEATGGVPPELLAQLQNQMGVELPNL